MVKKSENKKIDENPPASHIRTIKKGTLKLSTSHLYTESADDFIPEYENISYSNASSTLNTGDDFIIDFFTMPGIIVKGERKISVNRIIMNPKNAKILAEQILVNLKDSS